MHREHIIAIFNYMLLKRCSGAECLVVGIVNDLIALMKLVLRCMIQLRCEKRTGIIVIYYMSLSIAQIIPSRTLEQLV